ncbi:putative hydrolase or acyltransferase of alpha/beta superfamily [Thaumarchaeota archaeon SCGC AB-539-E09]|nr:putative hydrolase or acyltransferase of alpha/beta superfamily [Thaumarchaeota archaeon SCGC AB-539-E09]
MKTSRRILFGTATLILLTVFGLIYWAYTPLGPAHTALNSLIDSENVSVVETNRITFTPKTTLDTGLIFYPGGHVDPRSYSSIAHQIANKGYLVIIPKMPFNLAVINKRAAVKIIDDHAEIDNWVIGGHSLGGAMAASLVYDEPEMFEGLVLLAAYPPQNNNISTLDLYVTIVYGSLDQLATQPEIEESLPLLPFETEIVLIEGGNHAQFGEYGAQNGDGIATIGSEEQQKIVIEAILKTLKEYASVCVGLGVKFYPQTQAHSLLLPPPSTHSLSCAGYRES